MSGQIGGSSPEAELAGLTNRAGEVAPIGAAEFAERLAKARRLMREQGIGALVLTGGSNLLYFTGVDWHPSERLAAALLIGERPPVFVCPAFEAPRLARMVDSDVQILTWEEEEDPYALVRKALEQAGAAQGAIAVDEQAPYFVVDRLMRALGGASLRPAASVTSRCRRLKSPAEIAIIGHAMQLTLEVQRRTARMLRPGISAREVAQFIDEAHRRIAGEPSVFCIVSFGEATAYPHGGPADQTLSDGDMVLIDTGTRIHGYNSDLTRSYVFGDATERQRRVWNAEKEAQAAAFVAAALGQPCEAADAAARATLEQHGFGPGYAVPGLPHRTGHGLGLDLHEEPYLVRGNSAPFEIGMCFSNEPMICIYGEFGVRLEDHFHMTEAGPKWFTDPAVSIEAPFATAAG